MATLSQRIDAVNSNIQTAKSNLKSAIITKGGTISASNPTFQQLVDGVNTILSGTCLIELKNYDLKYETNPLSYLSALEDTTSLWKYSSYIKLYNSSSGNYNYQGINVFLYSELHNLFFAIVFTPNANYNYIYQLTPSTFTATQLGMTREIRYPQTNDNGWSHILGMYNGNFVYLNRGECEFYNVSSSTVTYKTGTSAKQVLYNDYIYKFGQSTNYNSNYSYNGTTVSKYYIPSSTSTTLSNSPYLPSRCGCFPSITQGKIFFSQLEDYGNGCVEVYNVNSNTYNTSFPETKNFYWDSALEFLDRGLLLYPSDNRNSPASLFYYNYYTNQVSNLSITSSDNSIFSMENLPTRCNQQNVYQNYLIVGTKNKKVSSSYHYYALTSGLKLVDNSGKYTFPKFAGYLNESKNKQLTIKAKFDVPITIVDGTSTTDVAANTEFVYSSRYTLQTTVSVVNGYFKIESSQFT